MMMMKDQWDGSHLPMYLREKQIIFKSNDFNSIEPVQIDDGVRETGGDNNLLLDSEA